MNSDIYATFCLIFFYSSAKLKIMQMQSVYHMVSYE